MFDFKTIRQIRKIKDVTLKELANKTGIAHSNISNIELAKKEQTSLRTVERILEPLGFRLVVAPIPKYDNCPCHFPTQGTTETYKEETLD